MNKNEWKQNWLSEERAAHIRGWDFSHIDGRYTEETDLPWSYKEVLLSYLRKDDKLLDTDTGGGEFLLSLRHAANRTSATEGYPPNVELCKKVLLPLGVDFREARDYKKLPFDDNTFDVVCSRHGSYEISEIGRVLKKGGIFVTQQVGEENDRELTELLLPGTPKPFPGWNLSNQRKNCERAGFSVLDAEEAFRPSLFFDVGALVWFAKIIEWEFPGFSVEKCIERLLRAQKILENEGCIKGTIHRWLLTARKNF